MIISPWNTAAEGTILSLRDHLRDRQERLVLAESCTAGMAAALLGQVPGISEFFCGSVVVYQTPIKHQWLGVSSEELNDPDIGPVSARVTEELAKAILKQTPQATLAASITGHLGPNAPTGKDGVLYCSFVCRSRPQNSPDAYAISAAVTSQYRLNTPEPSGANDLAGRRNRQFEAAMLLIDHIQSQLQSQNAAQNLKASQQSRP